MKPIDFKQAYGDVPEAFARRVDTTLRHLSEPEKERRPMKKTTVALVFALALLAMTTVAVAATLSHTADFFGVEYGPDFQQKLETGVVAPGGQTTTLNGVTFTLTDAVVVEEEAVYLADVGTLETPVDSLGFYATGIISPAEGENLVLLPEDYDILEPAGYSHVPYGENRSNAGEDAPSYARLAQEKNAKILWVTCIPNGILDQNGELLAGTMGMEIIPLMDGTVHFSVEIPPENVIEPQESYQLSLYIATKEVDAEGNPIDETRQSMDWVVTLTPDVTE